MGLWCSLDWAVIKLTYFHYRIKKATTKKASPAPYPLSCIYAMTPNIYPDFELEINKSNEGEGEKIFRESSRFRKRFASSRDKALVDEDKTVGEWGTPSPRITCRFVDVHYGEKLAINKISLDIGRNEVMSLIGPSGCGKSTLLRCLNRMNDTIPGCRVRGEIKLDGKDIYRDDIDVVPLRAKVGMVFQKPNPFPKSIFENVAYGPRIHGLASSKEELAEIVETSLHRAGLWEEVKDYLGHPGTGLSGGQQQRLCIARTIAVNPEVILMDEPCSALDPIATAKIEQLIDELREQYTIVIVTHSMQQAARVSQHTAYFHMGKLIEVGETANVFTKPLHKLTDDYISGRFG